MYTQNAPYVSVQTGTYGCTVGVRSEAGARHMESNWHAIAVIINGNWCRGGVVGGGAAAAVVAVFEVLLSSTIPQRTKLFGLIRTNWRPKPIAK